MARPLQSFLTLALLFPLGAFAAENWHTLKLGMTAEETIAALGQPLLRTGGRGFETWNYDKGGDVLMFGTLIGWTAPASMKVAVRSKDIWRENRGGPYLTFWSVLPPRTKSIPLRSEDAVAGTANFFYYYRK